MRHFDLCVIGSGPAGQKAAIQAAKLGKAVCVVEKRDVVGGASINTGTIPSKALREAIITQTSRNLGSPLNIVSRGGGEQDFRAAREAMLGAIRASALRVIQNEIAIVARHLSSNSIDVIPGTGSFKDHRTLEITGAHSTQVITADRFIIAVGTTPAKPEGIPFDDLDIITSDELITLPSLPRSIMIVGGGVIGTEYASMLAVLGVRVTLIEGRSRILDFVDAEISEALQYHLRQTGLTLRLGEKVVKITRVPIPKGAQATGGEFAEAMLESGKLLRADCLLYAVGRQGATDGLNLKAAGLEADDRGRIVVNSSFQTAVPHIYACGDVIGFPALASTSMEQGRQAACHMFGESCPTSEELLPYGIYSIPEISMVGWTEERLTKDGVPYEAGIAQYKEIARGQLLGDEIGMLKILIHQESHALLGVHAIGTGATELIHIGQAVMAHKGTVEYFVNTVFNYPTLAECYKVAALNGLNKLRNV